MDELGNIIELHRVLTLLVASWLVEASHVGGSSIKLVLIVPVGSAIRTVVVVLRFYGKLALRHSLIVGVKNLR